MDALFSCCSSRNAQDTASTAPKALAGVGVVFQPNDTGELYVKSLAVGGPAELSGQVKVGDSLREVNGQNVVGQSINTVAHMILGPPGTSVRLTIQRGTQTLQINLTRGWSLNSRAATPNRWSHPLPADSRLVAANVVDSQAAASYN